MTRIRAIEQRIQIGDGGAGAATCAAPKVPLDLVMDDHQKPDYGA